MKKHRFNRKYFAKRKQERIELDKKLRSVAFQFSTYGNIYFAFKVDNKWVGLVEGNRGFLVPICGPELFIRDVLKQMQVYFESDFQAEKETCRGA